MKKIFNLKRKRYFRLLPVVMLVCAGLLVLNASGIIHDAFGQTAAPAPADAMAAPAAPANHDFAGDDGEIATAAQVDVLTNLSKRRSELDAQQSQIQIQSNILAATESRVDSKISQLKALQSQIAALLAQRDAEQQKQIAALVKTYGPDGMKPANAAAIFNSLPDSVLIPVAQGLKPGDLGAILAKMNPDAAQKLTLKLANKLTLPDTTAALSPAPVPGAPAAPGTATPAAPVPGQQAQAAAAPAVPGPAPAAPKTGG